MKNYENKNKKNLGYQLKKNSENNKKFYWKKENKWKCKQKPKLE